MDLEGDYWKLIPPIDCDVVLNRAKSNILDIVAQSKSSSSQLIIASLLPISMKISGLQKAPGQHYL